MTRTTNITGLIAAFLLVMLIHEGFHVATGLLYGEFDRFIIHPYGFEVIFKTPVEQREGIKWFVVSGTSNIITTLLGYLMLLSTDKFVSRPLVVRTITYWLTVLFLIADPINMSVGPFLYGGDALGVAKGLEIPVLLVQGVAFIVLLINRELVATRLLPAYDIRTKHPLFVPWFVRTHEQDQAS